MATCCAFYKFVKFDGASLPAFQASLKSFCKSHNVYGMILLGRYLGYLLSCTEGLP